MILQAYDFAHLFREEGVTVQFGGSDQFGNIVAGADLIRRINAAKGADHEACFGLTWPLVTKADGGKFGKTETGAIWLTAERTSPYAYYQFWLNASDADALNWLKVFTFLPRERVEAITAAHVADPGKREAQRVLAMEATTILHGRAAAEQAEAAGKALFSGEIDTLDEATLREVFASVPSSDHAAADLIAGVDPVELLISTQLASSKREAREFVANGSVSVNGRKIGLETRLSAENLLFGSLIALRRGKKQWHLTRWA
jgi:tyrosyl-tRNA synthetase